MDERHEPRCGTDVPGGSLTASALIESAAAAALAGIPPLQFLRCTDPVEQLLLAEITKRHLELLDRREEIQASRIVSGVGKLFGGRRSSSPRGTRYGV